MSVYSEWRFRRNLTRDVYYFIVDAVVGVTGLIKDLNYEGLSNIPPQGPIAFTPKHVKFADPIYIGIGLHKAGTDCLYVSRPVRFLGTNVPARLLELTGSATLIRPKDFNRYGERAIEAKKKELKSVRDRNERTMQLLEQEMAHRGNILFFPEAERSPEEVRQLKPKFFKWTIDTGQEHGAVPSFLPVGLEYSQNGRGKERVSVRFGEPLIYDPSKGIEPLIEGCRRDIKLLSNL